MASLGLDPTVTSPPMLQHILITQICCRRSNRDRVPLKTSGHNYDKLTRAKSNKGSKLSKHKDLPAARNDKKNKHRLGDHLALVSTFLKLQILEPRFFRFSPFSATTMTVENSKLSCCKPKNSRLQECPTM